MRESIEKGKRLSKRGTNKGMTMFKARFTEKFKDNISSQIKTLQPRLKQSNTSIMSSPNPKKQSDKGVFKTIRESIDRNDDMSSGVRNSTNVILESIKGDEEDEEHNNKKGAFILNINTGSPN